MSAFDYLDSLPPPTGFVDLLEKKNPVCERNDEEKDPSLSFAYSRAKVDVSKLKAKINKLKPEDWDLIAERENVMIQRPAHDKWGVKKLIFTFCDDFLQKVYDLPLSQNEEWRQHILPIYDAIGVDEKYIVRSLLASMPPGMSIPIHHDTGYWVKHTHRIHVAVDTNINEVDFLVGPTENAMRRVIFDEGNIIELNNQAKHAVSNRMTNKYRTHLIFDYVDPNYLHPIDKTPLHRTLLEKGTKVNQTRRSIDLDVHSGSRPSPSFIIIGAQKSGTTSLFEMIMQHPLAAKGIRRESHFFDWNWQSNLKKSSEQLEYYRRFYPSKLLHDNPSLITGESTPSYMLHHQDTINRIKSVCPWAVLLIMLRDPVERAYSQYQMCIDTKGTTGQQKTRGKSVYRNKSFKEAIIQEIDELNSMGVCADALLGEFDIYNHSNNNNNNNNSSSSNNINNNSSSISNVSEVERIFMNYLSKCPMGHGGHSLVARGLYVLLLLPWLRMYSAGVDENNMNHNNENILYRSSQLMILSIDAIKHNKISSLGLEKQQQQQQQRQQERGEDGHITTNLSNIPTVIDTMHQVYSFIGLPMYEIAEQDASAKNTRDYSHDPIDEDCRLMLQEYYQPYNVLLMKVLKCNISWAQY